MTTLAGDELVRTTRTERVRRHYGAWAETYGSADDDGVFARVRRRELELVCELLALDGSESILDAGCGSGVHARPLAARGHEVWAVDFAPEMVDRVAGHVRRALVGDVTTLDLGRVFERVLCLGVLEFVADPLTVLVNLRRHLAPGGLAVVLAPRTGVGGRIYQLTKAWHGLTTQVYSPAALRRSGARAGLACIAERYPFFHNVVMAFRAV